jgi:hypothetical protein
MAEERWWKAPGMVALTSTETNTVFGLHWPGEPRAARWPELNDSPGLVGKGLLMSNEGWGVNRPSVESSDLTTARKVVPHATSPKGEKGRRSVRSRADAREGRRRTLEKYRVSDSGEEGE